MKVAIVHDYLGEFGGAERVLEVLCEIWPKAPIYTSFWQKNSPVYERFKKHKIVTSWAQNVPFFGKYLASPLRFLAPFIWNSFDFSDFDLVVTSASWYVTKGIKKGPKTVEICYCHTPPRYLYGFGTSVNWQKHWLVRVYALLVNHFMRIYDFEAAQRVNWFIANSQNVQKRIEKFYRRDSVVIYPPVDLPKVPKVKKGDLGPQSKTRTASSAYFLVVSRIVGAKGLQLAVETANKLDIKLKVVGKPAGYSNEYQKIKNIAGENVEFLGFVSDSQLAKLYAGAKAFLALATDEDFGMTPVEAMLTGTPVIAFGGGGYLETVIGGKTGLFFSSTTVESLAAAIRNFQALDKKGVFNAAYIKKYAQKFSKERFKREILKFVESKVK